MKREKNQGVRILSYTRPILQLLPEIERVSAKIPFQDKVVWTLLTLLLFLVCSQIPLYGISKMIGDDPMFWSRMILASNRGTLMELGIGPIVTASMVMQLLVGSKVIEIDQQNKEERDLLNNAQKLLALIIALFQAVGYVFGGMYGDIETIGAVRAVLIVVQLVSASAIVQLLDEILNNGYGVVGAISLFIATNVCEELLWKAFSPLKEGGEYEGAIIALFHYMSVTPSKLQGLGRAFYREHLPNLNNILATILVFFAANYFQGFHLNIAVHNRQLKGHNEGYPIKLFYTSNMPIILQSTLLSNIYFVSRLLYKRFPRFILIRLLGRYKEASFGGQSYPVSGLVYYLSAPHSLRAMVADPLHTLIYVAFILSSCAIFSRLWIDVSGTSAKEVHKSLVDQKITALGGTDHLLYKKLQKYIPRAAYVGGISIGILSLSADYLGAIGSGTGILLACGIIFEFYEELIKERKTGQVIF